MSKSHDLSFGFKVPFYPLDSIIGSAINAEKSGFASIWTADHLVGISFQRRDCYSAWSILSALAMKTNKTFLGTSVSDPCRFHPAIMAQFAMTLYELSRGRFIFGIGAGEAQNTLPYGIDCSKPVNRLEEAVRIMRKLLSGKETSFNGDYYKLKEAYVSPGLRRSLPIWIAANSDRTIEITAKYGDGWLPLGVIFDPDSYRTTLRKLQARSKRRQESHNKIVPGLFLHVAIASDEREARMMAEIGGKLQVLGWVPSVFAELSSEDKNALSFKKLIFDSKTSRKLEALVPKLPTEPVLERIVVGTPSQCLEKIDRYVISGAEHIVISFMGKVEGLTESIRLFSEKIIDYYV